MGEWLETIHYGKGFKNALMQCREVMEKFEGSEETLRHIRRVEEALKRLIAETN